ncbi:hypothetical protein Y032_0949g3173 [Ancylostoma ceylanicum]|uniref:Reverse transcriptase domain-containing protein n=1 Tax=Ancylostoma ceylanicum TaxID=53326 RepID=A0A016W8P7_9BILA|nr:hypothetical protein Y032_0949g3173 [Ancylostoma ceylanicum]
MSDTLHFLPGDPFTFEEPFSPLSHLCSALCPLLFILCMYTISSDLKSTTPWTLLYADDVMIAASTREQLQQKVQVWKDRLEQYGVRLNIKRQSTSNVESELPAQSLSMMPNFRKTVLSSTLDLASQLTVAH